MCDNGRRSLAASALCVIAQSFGRPASFRRPRPWLPPPGPPHILKRSLHPPPRFPPCSTAPSAPGKAPQLAKGRSANANDEPCSGQHQSHELTSDMLSAAQKHAPSPSTAQKAADINTSAAAVKYSASFSDVSVGSSNQCPTDRAAAAGLAGTGGDARRPGLALAARWRALAGASGPSGPLPRCAGTLSQSQNPVSAVKRRQWPSQRWPAPRVARVLRPAAQARPTGNCKRLPRSLAPTAPTPPPCSASSAPANRTRAP